MRRTPLRGALAPSGNYRCNGHQDLGKFDVWDDQARFAQTHTTLAPSAASFYLFSFSSPFSFSLCSPSSPTTTVIFRHGEIRCRSDSVISLLDVCLLQGYAVCKCYTRSCNAGNCSTVAHAISSPALPTFACCFFSTVGGIFLYSPCIPLSIFLQRFASGRWCCRAWRCRRNCGPASIHPSERSHLLVSNRPFDPLSAAHCSMPATQHKLFHIFQSQLRMPFACCIESSGTVPFICVLLRTIYVAARTFGELECGGCIVPCCNPSTVPQGGCITLSPRETGLAA